MNIHERVKAYREPLETLFGLNAETKKEAKRTVAAKAIWTLILGVGGYVAGGMNQLLGQLLLFASFWELMAGAYMVRRIRTTRWNDEIR